MKSDLLKGINKYKESHPEIIEIMKKFQMAQETYDRTMTSIGIKVQRIGPIYIDYWRKI